jgi:hypothetical protein
MFSSLSFLQADRSLVCSRCFFIPVEAVSPPNCVSQIYFLKEHYILNSLEASCLLSCVLSKLDACRIKIILYINPVLHGCQCFVLNAQVNVKVDSKPAVLKYSLLGRFPAATRLSSPKSCCGVRFNLGMSSYLYSFLALSRSLFSSRRLMVSRLSCLRLPLAIAMVILAFPFWKYTLNGIRENPFSLALPYSFLIS